MPVRVPRLDDQGRLVLGALPDLTATTTQKGLVELATATETQTGTDTTRAVTPAALSATYVSFRKSDGTPLTGKHVIITVTPDGTDIQDITVEAL